MPNPIESIVRAILRSVVFPIRFPAPDTVNEARIPSTGPEPGGPAARSNGSPGLCSPGEPSVESPCFKPRLHGLLRSLGLDVTYERAAGDHLYYREAGGSEIEVLDLVGGFGSLLLGHSHPTLVAEAQRLLASGRPMLAQGSHREHANRLAAELSRRAGGGYRVIFGNSGAEAVEAAMKHAMLETGGHRFIALERGFHGKTLGAVQLTASEEFRAGFDLPCLEVTRIPPDRLDLLRGAFERSSDLAGFVLEPVIGEGGVRPVDAGFAAEAARLCAAHGVPLIADECQTGLGRTGRFLACEALGIRPDYLVLSKILGGGLAKISATMVSAERYDDRFDLRHTSTYADDDFSCAIALRTLELIDDALLARCRDAGARLRDGLRDLARRHPAAIADVRGQGLMIGLEFHRASHSPSFLLRYLSSQEDLVWAITGYLLKAHRIRVAPTLSDPFTLRFEPSALIGNDEIERTLVALEDVCLRLGSGDALGLTRHLAQGGAPAPNGFAGTLSKGRFAAYDEGRFHSREAHSPEARVAWLFHLVDDRDLLKLEPAFAELSSSEREAFLGRHAPGCAPVVMSSVDIRSRTGRTVRFHPILLPVTSRWMKHHLEAGTPGVPRALVQLGIERARSLGCDLVSLGQYTSIVTRNGSTVECDDMGLCTGNSYSVALALQAVDRAHHERGGSPGQATLVIVGAAGNAGQTFARILSPHYRRTILVGRDHPDSLARLEALAVTLPNTHVTTAATAIRQGEVVIGALNAVDSPLSSSHFGDDAIVCDLSVPSGLKPGLAAERPDLLVIQGGIAALPVGEGLEIVDLPLPRGRAYGCLAEALLLGLEGIRDRSFTGALHGEHVARVAAMAKTHGFELADYRLPLQPATVPVHADPH